MISSLKTINEPVPLQQSGSRIGRPSWPPLWIPVALLIIISLIIRFGGFDERVEKLFWSPTEGWIGANSSWAKFLYHHGTKPALVATFAGAAYWLVCTIRGRKDWRKDLGAYLAMLMIIGPGLLVNLVFKEHFGRPRPNEVREFGGQKPFQPLGDPDLKVPGKSFPSGHASMGFFWLGLFVFLWNRNRKWAWFFCGLGLLHGLGMGLGRMMQGSHWPSDILWSAGFVYLTAWALYRWLFTGETLALRNAGDGLKN